MYFSQGDYHHCCPSFFPHIGLLFVSVLVFIDILVSVSHMRGWWLTAICCLPTPLNFIFLQLKTLWSSFPMAVVTFALSWKVKITCVSPGRSRVCPHYPSLFEKLDMRDIFYMVVKHKSSRKTCWLSMSFLFNLCDDKFCQVIQFQRTHPISSSATQNFWFEQKENLTKLFYFWPLRKSRLPANMARVEKQRHPTPTGSNGQQMIYLCPSVFTSQNLCLCFFWMRFFYRYQILPLACFWPMAANDNHLFVDKGAACFSFPVVLMSKIEEDVKPLFT